MIFHPPLILGLGVKGARNRLCAAYALLSLVTKYVPPINFTQYYHDKFDNTYVSLGSDSLLLLIN